MKKHIALGLLTASIIFLAGCKNQQESQNQTKTPTTKNDWKTYQNTKYGYGFDYPANFHLAESPELSSADSQDVSILNETSDLIVNIGANNSMINDGTGKCPEEYLSKFLQVDGRDIEICNGEYTKRFDFYATIQINSKDSIFIEIVGNADKKQQTQEFFEKFISTFRFTE